MNKYIYLTIIILVNLLPLSCNELQQPAQRSSILRVNNSAQGQSIMSSYKGSYALSGAGFRGQVKFL